MLKFSFYIEDKIDKAWFDSSNVVYGECDESNDQFKTVRIVFNNGSTYQYEKVLVSDWVSFKHAESQGKALNLYFKKGGYKYERIEDADLDKLDKEFESKSKYNYILKVDDENNKLLLIDNKLEEEKYSMDYPGEEITNSIKEMLESMNNKVNIENQNGK